MIKHILSIIIFDCNLLILVTLATLVSLYSNLTSNSSVHYSLKLTNYSCSIDDTNSSSNRT